MRLQQAQSSSIEPFAAAAAFVAAPIIGAGRLLDGAPCTGPSVSPMLMKIPSMIRKVDIYAPYVEAKLGHLGCQRQHCAIIVLMANN